jgi:hypothetical protein
MKINMASLKGRIFRIAWDGHLNISIFATPPRNP